MSQKPGAHPAVWLWGFFALILWGIGIYAFTQCAGDAEAQNMENKIVMPLSVRAPYPLNPSYEFGDDLGSCLWYDDLGDTVVIRDYCPQEVRAPQYIQIGWQNQSDNVCPPFKSGMPEMRMTDDPRRSRSGNALMWFTFWRCQNVWVAHRPIYLSPGIWKASTWFHAWYSDCSREPFGPPLASDCITPLIWGRMEVRIGMDAIDQVVWGDWHECYNVWCQIETPELTLTDHRWTRIIVESRSDQDVGYHPPKHQNMYIADLELERTQ